MIGIPLEKMPRLCACTDVVGTLTAHAADEMGLHAGFRSSRVGSRDCMLAGLAYGFTHDLPFEDALKYGVAAGTANTLTIGAGTFTSDDLERIRAEITLFYI